MLVVGHRVPRRHSSTSGSHPTNPLASVRGADPLRTCGFPPAYPLLVASPGGASCGRRLRGTHRGEAGSIGDGCTPGESAWVLPAGCWSKTLLLASSRSIFSPATSAAYRCAVCRAHLGPVVPGQGDAAQDRPCCCLLFRRRTWLFSCQTQQQGHCSTRAEDRTESPAASLSRGEPSWLSDGSDSPEPDWLRRHLLEQGHCRIGRPDGLDPGRR